MVPPPVTPAPSRFLLPSKRQSTQPPQGPVQTPISQQQYQQPQHQQPSTGPHQFHATPRFSSTSASARTAANCGSAAGGPAAAFSTPALSVRTDRVRRQIQDAIDDEFSTPDSASGKISLTGGRAAQALRLPEPIEIVSSSLVEQTQSSPLAEENGGRPPKRRRISITSSSGGGDGDTSPLRGGKKNPGGGAEIETDVDIASSAANPESAGFGVDDVDIVEDSDSDDNICVSSQHDSDSRVILDSDGDMPVLFGSSSPSSSSSTSPSPSRSHSHSHPLRRPQQQRLRQQPIFYAPPRFKPPARHPRSADGEDAADPNLDIFSPQRRGGARYLAGGLASELRDWLLETKESDAEQRRSHTAVRLAVEAVRDGGPGMMLVAGRPVDDRGRLGPSVRAVLAGEGLVEGLRSGDGNRANVVPGGVVTVAPPAWDVQLGERWAVAYRWEAERPG